MECRVPANTQQNEKATYRMGESICKPYIWWGINIQNIWFANTFAHSISCLWLYSSFTLCFSPYQFLSFMLYDILLIIVEKSNYMFFPSLPRASRMSTSWPIISGWDSQPGRKPEPEVSRKQKGKRVLKGQPIPTFYNQTQVKSKEICRWTEAYGRWVRGVLKKVLLFDSQTSGYCREPRRKIQGSLDYSTIILHLL